MERVYLARCDLWIIGPQRAAIEMENREENLMNRQPLQLLIVETAQSQVTNIVDHLTTAGYACRPQVVSTAEALIKALTDASYDLILANDTLPGCEGPLVLRLVKERQLSLPVILLAEANDVATAVTRLRAGASDYIIRDDLTRLDSAVALALGRQGQVARVTWPEERFRQVIASISDHVYVTEVTTTGAYINLYISPHIEALTGYPIDAFMADRNFWPSVLIHPQDRPIAAAQSHRLTQGHDSETEYRIIRADGQVIWVRDSARVRPEGSSKVIYGLVSNVDERKKIEQKIHELNENLEQRVIDRTRELKALYEITAIAGESANLEWTLTRSLERILVALEGQAGMIHLLDEAEERLTLAVEQGLPSALRTQVAELEIGQGMIGWVIQKNRPLLLTDFVTRLPEPVAVGPEFEQWVGVPIRLRGYSLGVLGLFSRGERHFSQVEIDMLSSIAEQLGVAIENAQLSQLAEHAAVMEERARLARELHDSVTQSLYSLTLLVGSGQRLARTGRLDDPAELLAEVGQVAQQAMKEMRLLVYELRPPILEQEGLVAALQQRLDAVEARAGVKTRLLVDPQLGLPAVVEEGLYNIAREALNNVLKHAEATSVTIQMATVESRLLFEISDDGQGFEPTARQRQGGMGLVGMRERVAKLGGSLEITSAEGEGTQLKISLPLTDRPTTARIF